MFLLRIPKLTTFYIWGALFLRRLVWLGWNRVPQVVITEKKSVGIQTSQRFLFFLKRSSVLFNCKTQAVSQNRLTWDLKKSSVPARVAKFRHGMFEHPSELQTGNCRHYDCLLEWWRCQEGTHCYVWKGESMLSRPVYHVVLLSIFLHTRGGFEKQQNGGPDEFVRSGYEGTLAWRTIKKNKHSRLNE